MYHIKTLNNIAPKGLAELPAQQFTDRTRFFRALRTGPMP